MIIKNLYEDLNIDGKMFERCNFACLELAGFMPLQRKLIENRFY
jgi:hypothetical protein